MVQSCSLFNTMNMCPYRIGFQTEGQSPSPKKDTPKKVLIPALPEANKQQIFYKDLQKNQTLIITYV